MNETKYLVDNNALIRLRRERVRTAFFDNYCSVTADVLLEADEHPEKAALAKKAADITPDFLGQLRAVMATVTVGDTSLVNLYKNKGAADPGLIAFILEESAINDGKLFCDHWVLVTNDHAVADKAAEFNVDTVNSSELAALIDASLS